jgi:hypothetical protein
MNSMYREIQQQVTEQECKQEDKIVTIRSNRMYRKLQKQITGQECKW